MLYLEGPAFQEHDSADYSGFNAIWVNLLSQEDKIATFSWNKSLFEPNEVNVKWQPFRRTRRLLAKDFHLTEDMERELDDPGATFIHPTKQTLALSDIFVFPDAKEIIIEGTNKPLRENHIESKDLLKFVSNKRRLLIVGKERSGKTSLGKILYRDYYAKGFVPVLLKGEQINSLELDKFERLVEQQWSNQYQNPKLPAFNQLDRDQTVIIIDDFDDTRYPSKGRYKLLSNIHKRFERVLILCDDATWWEDMATGQFSRSALSEYTQIALKDYGYYLRSKLIEQWCRLGAEYSITEQDLECKITRYERLIDTALQRSYLPSLPFFILIYIQSLDAAQPVSESAGSYGHLCDLLISRSLATVHKFAKLNTKRTYLSELAYAFFNQNTNEFSEEAFQMFHQIHCGHFTLQLDREAMFKELSECLILTRIEGRYRFKYPYYQHYFVALYMSDHLHEQVVRGQVEAISKKLYKGDNADIWLFLSHLSKNPLLLDLILAHAKTIFPQIPVARFEDDISFFKRISDSIPAVVLFNRTPAELREARRRQLDTTPQDEDVSDEGYEISEVVRFIVQLTDALRTLDVMGQIAKNFSGSLVGPIKFELIDGCYQLGLRVAGVVVAYWKDDPEKVVNELVDMILDAFKNHEELKKITRAELIDKVKELFFFLTESVAFAMLKRISHAVGSLELIPTYKEVLDASPTNAYKLVDMSVKLDTLGFPSNDLVLLNGQLKDNLLCRRLLCKLVVDHIYLFPTDYRTKQRICETLGIAIKELRGIDLVSEAQKRIPSSR
jgi:hypoxanthine phosphoribosyltransferase